ncbi:hypothetical protein BKA81DRAFT_383560 [Phyllosticta paracitricarpa]
MEAILDRETPACKGDKYYMQQTSSASLGTCSASSSPNCLPACLPAPQLTCVPTVLSTTMPHLVPAVHSCKLRVVGTAASAQVDAMESVRMPSLERPGAMLHVEDEKAEVAAVGENRKQRWWWRTASVALGRRALRLACLSSTVNLEFFDRPSTLQTVNPSTLCPSTLDPSTLDHTTLRPLSLRPPSSAPCSRPPKRPTHIFAFADTLDLHLLHLGIQACAARDLHLLPGHLVHCGTLPAPKHLVLARVHPPCQIHDLIRLSYLGYACLSVRGGAV